MKKCWCGNENLQEYSESYYKCAQCGTLVSKCDFSDSVYKVSDETEDLYGENYWEVKMTKAAGKNTISEIVDMYLSERVIYWLKYILRYVKLGGTVAEIGCGLGQLQYVLRRIEYPQTAFELSENICRFIKEKLEVNVCCGDFTRENTAVYNGILAFDLFEHLINPEEFLCKCSASMQDGGVLVFQTPCYDSKLNYTDMLQLKPRFQQQLKSEQHIFLYSKESMTNILKKHGFTNIIFEPAFFGDDYDMFFFASKSSIQQNSKEAIENFLNSANNGRLVKAMIALFDRNQELTQKYEIADRDRNDRLEQNKQLEQILKQSQSDDSQRQVQIEKLTEMLKGSEADRAARLEQINKLTEMLKESEADRAARLEQINKLTEMLQEKRTDK